MFDRGMLSAPVSDSRHFKRDQLTARQEIEGACAQADWGQVVANGGPPCFHVEHGRFCFRALRWDGHDNFNPGPFHPFVSLFDFIRKLNAPPEPAAPATAETGTPDEAKP